MAERRQVARSKSANGALIFYDKQCGARSSVMRDVGNAGGGLRLNDRDVIAPVFEMTLNNFRNIHTCQLVRSRGRHIGAIFEADNEL